KCEILRDRGKPGEVEGGRKQLGGPPQLMDAVIDRDRAHPSFEIDDIGLNIGQCDLGRCAAMELKPIGPLQKAQECSVPPCEVVAAHLGQMACGASWLKPQARSACLFPGTSIGVRPFAHRQRARALESGLAVREVRAGHYSAASNSSSICSMTILLKISLAWLFSNPI